MKSNQISLLFIFVIHCTKLRLFKKTFQEHNSRKSGLYVKKILKQSLTNLGRVKCNILIKMYLFEGFFSTCLFYSDVYFS